MERWKNVKSNRTGAWENNREIEQENEKEYLA